MSQPTNLIIYATSTTPLAPRYSVPPKQQLILPSIIHSSLHKSLDTQSEESYSHSKSTLRIPNLPPAAASTPDGDAELTVKLHLATTAALTTGVQDALETLKDAKGWRADQIETLLVGFKGVDYKGKRTAAGEMFGCGSEYWLSGGEEGVVVCSELTDKIIKVWESLADLASKPKTLGTLYLPQPLLTKLIASKHSPKVNALNTPDCHLLPQAYTAFAKENDIELWAGGGGEGADILPDEHLHNLLKEFAPVLAPAITLPDTLIPLTSDSQAFANEPQPKVSVQWVLGYTLVSSSRNVVQDKGYIVSAQVFA